jgi:hypothetical protein
MEIALLLIIALVLFVGYDFIKKYKADNGNVQQASVDVKNDIVSEAKKVETEVETEIKKVEEVVKKVKKPAAKKATSSKKAAVKKPKITIAK